MPGDRDPTHDSLGGIDRVALGFAAVHELITIPQIAIAAASRQPVDAGQHGRDGDLVAGPLADHGLLLRHPALHGQPPLLQITRRGLDAIQSPLPVPRAETIRPPAHEIAVAWLWLHISRGDLGPYDQLLTRREMRHHDRLPQDSSRAAQDVIPDPDEHAPPYAVRLNPARTLEAPELHYPDLIITPGGQRIAVELVLKPPGTGQLRTLIAAYTDDPNITASLFMVPNRPDGEHIQHLAANLHASDTTHIQLYQPGSDPWPTDPV